MISKLRVIIKSITVLYLCIISIGDGALYAQSSEILAISKSLQSTTSDTAKIDIYSQLILSYATIKNRF